MHGDRPPVNKRTVRYQFTGLGAQPVWSDRILAGGPNVPHRGRGDTDMRDRTAGPLNPAEAPLPGLARFGEEAADTLRMAGKVRW